MSELVPSAPTSGQPLAVPPPVVPPPGAGSSQAAVDLAKVKSEILTPLKETNKPHPPAEFCDAAPTMGLIILAGLLGGIVSTMLTRNDDGEDKPLDGRLLFRNICIGIGAAFLIPLFLKSVSSTILSSIDSREAPLSTYLVFFGYCVLGAISARHLISTLTEKVLQEVRTVKKENAENAKEIKDTKAQVEKAKSTTEATKNLALANNDALRLGTQLKLAPTAPTTPLASTLNFDATETESIIQSSDPWKNKFGGLAERNGRKIIAVLTPIHDRPDLAAITLKILSTNKNKPLTGSVQFFLHPQTYENFQPIVPVVSGIASLNLTAYGAFTVGATCDDGRTTLEIDLSTLPDAWEPWKSR